MPRSRDAFLHHLSQHSIPHLPVQLCDVQRGVRRDPSTAHVQGPLFFFLDAPVHAALPRCNVRHPSERCNRLTGNIRRGGEGNGSPHHATLARRPPLDSAHPSRWRFVREIGHSSSVLAGCQDGRYVNPLRGAPRSRALELVVEMIEVFGV